MSLTTRTAKGSKLTIAEMDGNLTYLNDRVQLCSTQIITDEPSSVLPSSLTKTSTTIEYSNGVKLQGWKLIAFSAMNGSSNNFQNLVSVNIPTLPEESTEGYYLPLGLSGTVKAFDSGSNSYEITIFQNGAGFQDSISLNTIQCDSLSIFESTSGSIVDFTITGLANSANPAIAEISTQFEFLCYDGVTPEII